MEMTAGLLVEDFLSRAFALFQLRDDREDTARKLIQAAITRVAQVYQRDFHHLTAAALGFSGQIYFGDQIDCKIGQVSICAEALALTRAEEQGDGLRWIVTVHHGHEDDQQQIVLPCAMCRERLAQFAPSVRVIVPWRTRGLIALPIEILYPFPYGRRLRPGPPPPVVLEPVEPAELSRPWPNRT